LKILFVLHLPPPVHGPAVIGENIRQSKLINSRFECRYFNLSISSSLNDIGATNSSKFFRYINLLWAMSKQLIFNRPDLSYLTIYSWGPGFYKDSLVALMVKLFRVKTVYHFHNKGLADHRIGYLENLLYNLVFRNADIILISDRLYNDFRKYVPENRVHYCTNGIPEYKNPAIGDRHHFSSPYCSLLFHSNLFESKGTFILLEACKILKDRNLKFHCTFSGAEGDITRAQFLSKVNELDLVDSISYEGMKLNSEKDRVFSEADIFIHPSSFDCLPLVILEAMQYSLPVVSTHEGAIPDAVEDGITGFLAEKKDPVALAEKLELLIKDPDLRKKMGTAGREKYEKEFTLERFENRLSEIITEIGRAAL
jgi:glycosyltransferase involved in cell wall biosynthesis